MNQGIQFLYNDPPLQEARRAIAPIIYQASKTIAVGTGIDYIPLIILPEEQCSAYGGQIINSGCYDVRAYIEYLSGADCDVCTPDYDNLKTECMTVDIPADSSFPIPEGFWGSIYIATIDEDGNFVANTSAQKVKVFSTYTPSCTACLQYVVTRPDPYDSGLISYSGGAGREVSSYNWPENGYNIWFWNVDNSFNIKINGQSIASVQEVNLWPPSQQTYINAGLTCATLTYADGSVINGSPWSYSLSNPNPMIKVNVSAKGVITASAIRNGVYVPVVFSNGASWNNMADAIRRGCAGLNTLSVSQSNASPPTNISFKLFG